MPVEEGCPCRTVAGGDVYGFLTLGGFQHAGHKLDAVLGCGEVSAARERPSDEAGAGLDGVLDFFEVDLGFGQTLGDALDEALELEDDPAGEGEPVIGLDQPGRPEFRYALEGPGDGAVAVCGRRRTGVPSRCRCGRRG